jgi:hypothetical protein
MLVCIVFMNWNKSEIISKALGSNPQIGNAEMEL